MLDSASSNAIADASEHRVNLMAVKALISKLLGRDWARRAGRAGPLDYPTQPIRIVVPFARGGITDVAARLLRVKLERALGQGVRIENHAGGGGTIGAGAVAKAAADGYTLLMGSCGEIAIAPAMQPGVGFDPLRDLMPVVLVAITPLLIVASADAPFKSLRELIDFAAARRHSVNYATSGVGGPHHLTGEWLSHVAGIPLLNVSYGGGAPAVADVVRGRVPLAIVALTPALPHIRSGKINVLAVTTNIRAALSPEWPSVADAGYAGFDTSMWVGLFVPVGTPSAVVTRLNSEVNRALALPDVRTDLAARGGMPEGGSPEEFAAFIRSEIAKYTKVIAETDIRPIAAREAALQMSST
jgi:tripartite-type tricarboxylate transporter receptor subunit TctC